MIFEFFVLNNLKSDFKVKLVMIRKFMPEAKINSINVTKTNPIGEYSLSIIGK
tara:strand:- start:259 stop:417 length:159 start_codon:yes stop_codon:yes gene_type:complete